MKIKNSLLESLIKICVKEVLCEWDAPSPTPKTYTNLDQWKANNLDANGNYIGEPLKNYGFPIEVGRVVPPTQYMSAMKLWNMAYKKRQGNLSLGSPLGMDEEAQPEPYDPEMDIYQPSPRDRTMPSANPKTPSPEMPVQEGGTVESKISAKEKQNIAKAFAKVGLDGNGRFQKVEHGLAAVTSVLDSLGFNLDMVSADMIMGPQGTRALVFRRKNDPGQDQFTEKPEIVNSRIAFNWTNLSGAGQPPRYEVQVYPS